MADLATLQTRLDEAEAALHKLQTGAQVASVGDGQGNVQYTSADVDKLRAYVRDLKAQISTAQGTRGRRPIGIRFGGLT